MRLQRFLAIVCLAGTVIACNGGGSGNPNPNPSPSSTGNGLGGGGGGIPEPTPSPLFTPDATDAYWGPKNTTMAEYHLPASVDSDVLANTPTEEWAALYRPASLGIIPLPLVVMLHGNHSTCGTDTNPIVEQGCQYTFSGSCSQGQIVIPNHLGYDYLAKRLAAWGYLVLSINANMGITCGTGVTVDSGLNLARGRLILRHLALLSQWNKNGGTPASLNVDLRNKIDFSNVGLFGHSRGGEGVRAAYNLYKNDPNVSVPWSTQILSPVTFKALFEIGPVDGQTSMTLNAIGAAWNVLLPMCDGDIVALEGMKPFDRMVHGSGELFPGFPKSIFAVYGANHDFYNTEWQSSDSSGCSGITPIFSSAASSSSTQQGTAIASVIPFFRAHVATQNSAVDATTAATIGAEFNPLNNLEPWFIANQVWADRSYIASPASLYTTPLETFTSPAGTGSGGQPESTLGVTVTHGTVPEHDASFRAAEIVWTASGPNVFYQDNWTALGSGISTSNVQTLDFRMSRRTTQNSPTDFKIQLVFNDGSLGPSVRPSSYVKNLLELEGPFGSSGSLIAGNPTTPILHGIMPTIRIPIADLAPGSPTVTGVRFTFDSTASGDIFVSDIGFSTTQAPNVLASTRSLEIPQAPLVRAASVQADIATLSLPKPVNRVGMIRMAADAADTVEVEVESTDIFPARNALSVLRMNGAVVSQGGSSMDGDLHHLTFRVKQADIDAQPEQFSMDVGYQEDPDGEPRDVGTVAKAMFPHS